MQLPGLPPGPSWSDEPRIDFAPSGQQASLAFTCHVFTNKVNKGGFGGAGGVREQQD